FGARYVELVGPADDLAGLHKSTPFASSRLPRIRLGGSAALKTPGKIDEKKDLSGKRNERRDRDEALQGKQSLGVMNGGELRVAARVAGHPKEVHRQKGRIGSDEGEPEVRVSEARAHVVTEHSGKPEICSCKNPHHGSNAHDQVEVSDHEVRVVQVHVE